MTTSKKPTPKNPADVEVITDLRDNQLLSWAKVAEALGLGSPGAARRAYSALVRPHKESVLPGHSFGTAKVKPVHLADADLDTLREALVGHVAVVQRAKGTEDVAVAKVTSVKSGTISLNDGNKSRSIKAEAIVGIR